MNKVDIVIKQQAELYAESFRYKIDDVGWHEQKVRDFIAGYEAALRIHNVSRRSEQLVCDACKRDKQTNTLEDCKCGKGQMWVKAS